MSNRALRGAFAVATTLVTVVALGAAGSAFGSGATTVSKKKLKVSCDQLYVEIEKTGAQFQAQYNAKGFTIGLPSPLIPDPSDPSEPPTGGDIADGVGHGGACQKQGKTIRQGNGYMIDIHSDAEPPFPGEPNPGIREYDWLWNVTVKITKKGVLRDTVTNFRCKKYIYDGSPGDPSNIQTFPC